VLNDTAPVPQPKAAYGTVILSPVAPLLDQRIRQELGKEPVRSQFPLTFEQLGQRYGFMLYETTLAHSAPDPAVFSIPNLSDRAIVLLDDVSSESIFCILHYCYWWCYHRHNTYVGNILYVTDFPTDFFHVQLSETSCFFNILCCPLQTLYTENQNVTYTRDFIRMLQNNSTNKYKKYISNTVTKLITLIILNRCPKEF
jgi:hypothetical protein